MTVGNVFLSDHFFSRFKLSGNNYAAAIEFSKQFYIIAYLRTSTLQATDTMYDDAWYNAFVPQSSSPAPTPAPTPSQPTAAAPTRQQQRQQHRQRRQSFLKMPNVRLPRPSLSLINLVCQQNIILISISGLPGFREIQELTMRATQSSEEIWREGEKHTQ